MHTAPSANGWIIAVVAVLLCYRLYQRFRANIGPQRVSERRLILRAVIFAALGVFLALAPGVSRLSQEAMGTGLVLGVLLGALGLNHTRFEKRGEQPFYIPNTYIGLGVTALFIGRIAYRIVTVYPQMQQQAGGALPRPHWFGPQQSPLTLALFGLVVGYYVVYNLGLVVLSRRAHAVSLPVTDQAEEKA